VLYIYRTLGDASKTQMEAHNGKEKGQVIDESAGLLSQFVLKYLGILSRFGGANPF